MISMDGSKLPLFMIFISMPGGSIKRSLPSILPDGVIGCVQAKAWMDNRTMNIWYNTIIKLYIAGYSGCSGLLLDDFKCHYSESFNSILEENGVLSYMISPHYTAFLQPCDVGINKSLKDRLKQCASK